MAIAEQAAAKGFTYTTLSPQEHELRREVRDFLRQELPTGGYRPCLGMAAEHDRAFTEKMARRGWVGMSIPARYGGPERSAVDRFIVVEEMLKAGAPVGAHWVADRQSAPTILRFGTEEQRERFLPAIARGELAFSIGMSEPDAGSDLAAVRTTATRTDGGWLLNGTKIWTSNAHQNDWFIVLCRSSHNEGDRHEGLSQLLVPLQGTAGLEINPIKFLDGSHHFNEVVMTDVFVPDELVLGEIGRGWSQVNSELAYERAGPDRWLSVYATFEQLLREKLAEGELSPDTTDVFGRITARYWALRNLSLSIARTIDQGGAPAVEAAIVKDLGTMFEQEMISLLHDLWDEEPSLDAATLGNQLLAACILTGPSFTLRGGTNEILRTVASKGLANWYGVDR
jgi:alkylation response protein AidB-like acyl-CoA dehydrogenase